MDTITIPKKVTKGEELVIIPLKEYEEFSQWKKISAPLKKFKTFTPTAEDLRILKEARESYRRGEYVVIKNKKDLNRELGITP